MSSQQAFTLNQAPAIPQDRYWAAVEADDLPNVIVSKALMYRDRLRRDGRLDLFRRSERTYYGQDAEGGMANSAAVTFGGEQGELVMIRVNHYRTIVQGLLATAANKRPSYDVRASNTDTEAAQQTVLARSLLEFYLRECDLETFRVETARTSLVFGEGYEALRWNPFIGRPLTTEQRPVYGEDGQPKVDEAGQPVMEDNIVREGDIEVHVFTPFEVIHDLDRTRKDMDWCILPYRENVWDLAARYPEHRDRILALRGTASRRWPRSAWTDTPWERNQATTQTDISTVWWLYHAPCDALPQGRHAIVVGEVVIYDGPFELPEIPVYCVMPEREVSVARGHSPMFDLLAIQEAYDAVVDIRLSLIDSHGLTNIVAPKGSDITPEQISKGLQLIEYTPTDGISGGAPEALNLLNIPQSLTETEEMLKQLMETLSGINSVIRGDPMPQLKSGAALALVQSLAVAFNTAFQSAVIRHDERVGTGILKMLKLYATNQRQVEIVGRANRGAMLDWSRDSLSSIERVIVEVGSPLQNQTAGKLEITQQMLQNQLIKTPAEFFEVLTTGRLEPVYRADKAELDLIARENELLADPQEYERHRQMAVQMATKAAQANVQKAQLQAQAAIDTQSAVMAQQGLAQAQMGLQAAPAAQPVVAKMLDDHGIHILEHRAVLAEPAVRLDPVLSERVMQHIKQHSDFWHKMGPEFGALTKQSVPPPAIIPQPTPGGAPQDAPGGPKANGSLQTKQNPERAQPLGQEPPQGGPMMPENPMTGQRAPNPGPQ